MKIRTRVKIAGVLAVCVLLAYGAVVLHLDRTMSDLAREIKETNEIVNKISILRNLTQDYLLYHTERAQRQWAALYDEVSRLLETPQYRVLKEEYGLGDAPQKLKIVGDTFSRLMTVQQTAPPDHPEGGAREELKSRLATQLLLATQDLLTRFFHLTEEVNQKLIRTQRLMSLLDILALVSLGLIIISAGVFLQRSVVKPVLRLHEGAEIIGAGNLDHQVGSESPDEVGELTRAFDRMTANLRQMNLSLDTERRRFFEVLEMLPTYVVLLTPDYHVAFANRTFIELFGEDQGHRCYEYLFGRTEPCEICATYKTFQTNAPQRWEWTGPNGRNYDIYDYPFPDVDGSPLIMEMGVDITDRKRAEETLKLLNRLLEIANRQMEVIPLVQEFVAEIKEFTLCEAVGIRLLDEAGNIPYHGYAGFSKEFYEIESPLSIHSDQCMCINVVKGTTDPSLPFYTPGGSFYMNGTTRFLATVSEKDKGSTRNVCNATGYESVGLVPIRLGERIMGLIHLADRKEDLVPLEKVELLEKVGLQLSSALERVKAQEELRRFSKTLEQRVRERTAQLERSRDELVREIEERKSLEEERELALKILGLVNAPNELRELTREVVEVLREWCGCEAGGIRLRDGADFPYVTTQGLSPEFVEAENWLCSVDEQGELIRDSEGHPLLECMCGNIIQGRFNPDQPFFTKGGSFWTNSTTHLLATTTETDRLARTRNRCHTEGYESFTLVPLRSGAEVLGLLQLNDRAVGKFTPEKIEILERLAATLSSGLARRLAEEALRQSEEHYRSLFDHMLDGFAYCRMHFEQNRPVDFTYLKVNDAFETLTGLKNVVGKKVSEVIPGIHEANPEILEIYGRVALTGQPERFETYLDPLKMWLSISVYSPQKEYFVAVFDVITARKQAERNLKNTLEDLERTNLDLERSNRDLEEFAYVASHDLQEPLRKIANFSEMLGEQYRGRLDEHADRYLGYVADGAKRMQALITDLLSYSRVGRADLPSLPASLEDILQGTLNDLQSLIQESGAHITHDPLPTANVNSYHMGQLLQNLLVNAIKFHGDRSPRIHISARQEGREWVISVRDEGIGFDSQHAERIFKVFHRLHAKEKYPGTGIGLAICKKIVEQHGGRCWAESQPGLGSTFYFTIPA